MAVQPGNRVMFVRGGKALEGRVFAVREGACSVEGPGSRAYYLEHWEVLLVLGLDEDYLRWLNGPLDIDATADAMAKAARRGKGWRTCRMGG